MRTATASARVAATDLEFRTSSPSQLKVQAQGVLPLVPSTTERDKKAVKCEGKRRAIQPERLAQSQLGTHNANKNPLDRNLNIEPC